MSTILADGPDRCRPGLACGIPGGVSVAGRRREMHEVSRLLERAVAGTGGLLVFAGPTGSGKTAIVEAAAGEARRRGFEVLRALPPAGQPGRLVWAQLLRDTSAPESLIAGLLGDNAGPLDADAAARHLVTGPRRLIVVDDVDRGGAHAVEMLSVVAARSVTVPTAVIATAATVLVMDIPGTLWVETVSRFFPSAIGDALEILADVYAAPS